MWSTFALSPGTTYVIRFPEASLYFRAEGVLWGVASEYTAKSQKPARAAAVRIPPKALDWKYSALLGAAELTLRPMLSQRAYEVQLGAAVSILPGVELDGYVFLPLHAEVLAAEGTILASLPLRRRKNSWFGSPQEGVLCEAVLSDFCAAEELGRFLSNP